MNILGISEFRIPRIADAFGLHQTSASLIFDGHDSAAAIVCDGTLVAAAEEERFTRIKHDNNVPINAIGACLRQAGLTMSQVDALAVPYLPYRTGPDSQHGHLPFGFLERMYRDGRISYRSLLHKCVLDRALKLGIAINLGMRAATACGLAAIEKSFGLLPPVAFYDHHLSHAAATYFTSGLKDATIVSIDGWGGNVSAAVWHGRGSELRLLRAEPYYNSLGNFYEHCTRYLGLGDFGEGKTMGLASYGDSETYAREISYLLDSAAEPWFHIVSEPTAELLGFAPGTEQTAMEGPYPDFAAAVQRGFEAAVERTVDWAIVATGVGDLCLGGGAFLNCTCNGRLRRSPNVRSAYIFPGAGDQGLCVGAALLHAARCNEPSTQPLRHSYLGPDYTDGDCLAALECASGVAFFRPDNLPETVAEILASGQAVGWFQGRMEFGPRALGARSILADPRTLEMRDRVNRIKRRAWWRPLAPAVLAGRAVEYFEMNGESPFMLFAVNVRPEKRSLIPAAVHVDGSARPQTVTREQNPRYYDLLAAFERRTGVPVLLNTSFNLAEEPIVCTPQDAIKSFLTSGLDALVLGGHLVRPTARCKST